MKRNYLRKKILALLDKLGIEDKVKADLRFNPQEYYIVEELKRKSNAEIESKNIFDIISI